MIVLNFLFLLFLLSLFVSSLNHFSICLLIFSVLFFVFYGSHFYFCSSLVFDFIFFDEYFLFLNLMSCFVLFLAFTSSLNSLSNNCDLTSLFYVFFLMIISVFFTFSSSNLLLLYISYEISLLPILFIIVNWGSYPERSLSSLIILGYTSLFSLPFIYVLFFVFLSFNSFYISLYSSHSFPLFFVFLSFFVFSVKLPIYGLHYWLPMAHVEAPTFGSVILAGILLNLGGVGLMRLCSFFCFCNLRFYLLSYLIIFLVYSSLVCILQSDFNRLIAYSSVVHIISIPFLVIINSIFSLNVILMIILFHGFSSPILFMLVGVLYSMMSTRQLILLRGFVLLSPLLSFMIVLAFFFTLPAPPFISFLSEVFFMIISFCLDSSILYFFILFTFFSLVYNINWLSSLVFSFSDGGNSSFSHSNFLFLDFAPMFLTFIYSFSFIVYFLCF